MNRKFLRGVSFFLVVLTGMLAFSISFPKNVHAAWLTGWAYKMPITIANNPGVAQSDYQVKISLTASSFDFSKAKSDGSDIRFTALDGITLLPYWMESWTANTSGTFWVKVPTVPANGSVFINMYYGNPGAASISNGPATFYSFEDFESTPWTAWTKEGTGIGTFTQSTDRAKRGSNSGKFVQPSGASASTVFSKASSLPGTNFIQEWDFYDDMADAPAFKMVRANNAIPGGQIGLGVWTGTSTANYAYHNSGYGYTATSLARSLGWHIMGIRVTSDGNPTFFIDGSQVGSLSGSITSANRISVEGIQEGPTTYYVDDFRVRKYASPEPTVTLGQGGTGSVDMAIAMTDSPDPIKVSQTLTYQLAVNNYGDVNATNVSVIDTLPAEVTFISATSTLGTCSNNAGVVTCSLGSVASGGSATITIQVTSPAQVGMLSNTATVTCTETDANTANNTSTATTVVGNPVVYVVNGVDTEAYNDHPMGTLHTQFDLRNFIKGTTVYIGPIMEPAFRNSHLDSFNNPFKMTWYVEMDNFINNGIYADGSPMDYLTLYKTFMSNYGAELNTWGDELAYHHHFMTWNGTSWVQMTDGTQLTSGAYDEQNNALDHMLLDTGFFPADFRSGWLWDSNEVQAWVEKNLLSDFSGPFGGNPVYFTYHPLATNYTQVDTTNNIKHFISGCDGSGSNATNISAAFAQAASTGKPVIYCWFSHDRENMGSYINSLQTNLTSASSASGVPFIYATTRQALQDFMGTTDTTPPILSVAKGTGDTFNITSNESLWNNAPYVAARYLTPGGLKYVHTSATGSGTSWTATLPDQKTFTTTIPAEKYPVVGATATHSDAAYPPTLAIDGNEGTYWDSGVTNGLPQSITVDLGSTQSVKMMTVHFYDLDSRTYTYNIDASTDGSNWTPIVQTTTVHGTGTHEFSSPVDLRYARVTVTNGSASFIAHIFEISLFKTLQSTISVTGDLLQASVGAGDLAGNTAVATSVVRSIADLEITQTSTPSSGRVGVNLTYNLTVTNHGPSTAASVQVTDNLPSGLNFVSATPSVGTCSGAPSLTCDLGDLANGASATISIVVTPQAIDTYSNTASVSTASSDPVQTNNTATLSTTVGNPVVYIVSAVDTEAFNNHPTTPQHVQFDVHNFIKGQSTYIGPLMAADFRNAHLDSFSTPFKMTWYVEMDNFINNGIYADGTAMNYLTLYNTFVNNFSPELATWGDELAYHHHFTVWNGTAWVQDGHQHATDGQYDEHNNALDRMILDAGFFPTDFRSGWLNESNQLQAWVDQWMLSDDSGSGWATGWIPYHPSATDYTQAGSMNHWMVNCQGGDITSAFTQASNSGGPVIYCWYGHDREDLLNYLNGIQSSATAASASSGIPFKYATAKEALQAIMGTTDTTPPTLTVIKGSGDTFNINSNEPIWNNAPYMAARYLAPSGFKYIHTSASSTGTNAWVVTIPATQTYSTTIPPEKYIPVSATASSQLTGHEASKAIDGVDSGESYWDSTPMTNNTPNWIIVDLGVVKTVPQLTIHFWDGDSRTYTYYVESSQNGTDWTQIVASNTVHGLATHTFETPIDLRFVKVTVTGSTNSNNYAHIYEITLYKTTTTTTVTETGSLQEVGAGALDLAGNSAVANNVQQALADLEIAKTAAPIPAYLGSNLTYTLTVTNHGPSIATAVQVTDDLPAGLTFVSATPSQGTCISASPVSCSLGDLSNGASATVTIIAAPQFAATYVNTASVISSSADINPANNSATISATVNTPMADLALTKTASSGSIRLGSDLTYTLMVTNNGPLAADSVQLTDTLPSGVNFVSAAASQGTCSGTSSITCNLNSLANGASATVTIIVQPTAEGSITNTANVSTTTIDTNQANNTSSVTTTVGNPAVYVVIAIDTEADNNHPMGSLHTTFDVHNYQRSGGATCQDFLTKYSSDGGATWTAYPTGSTVFNFSVAPNGGGTPTTSFTCGSNNAYGLDDYGRAVQFTVPTSGSYDVSLQLSVVGAPPDTNIYVVPDVSGNPDIAYPLSTYTAKAATIAGANGDYFVIGTNLSLTAGTPYWWYAARQSSGSDTDQFVVYQGSSGSSNTFAQIMDPAFRSLTTDSSGHPFEMSWFMEMDNFINNGFYANGQPMNYLTLYNELMNNWGNEVRGYGDEIAYHHHFMYWDGSSWQMGGQEQAISGPYDEQNNALDRMVLDARFFPTDFRAGWLNNDNQMQAWIEKYMLADVGGNGWGGTGWEPYHPSSTNYQQVGNMNHWMANCPGGPSQAGVNDAFAQAAQNNRPVLLCWYMHERDDMKGLVAAANTYLHTAAAAPANQGIPFIYSTSKEAMQAIIGTSDTTSPVLTITPTGGGNFRITSNETLWGTAPYVAAKYSDGTTTSYLHLAALPGAANTWTVAVPVISGGLPLKQVGTGAIDLSGNSAVANTTNMNAPVAVADSYTTSQDTALVVAAPGLLANDTDADGDPLTAVKVTDPAHGTLSLNSNGSFTYTPTNGFSGSDSFTYKANDGTLDSNIATVSLQVTAGGTPPLPASFFGLLHFNRSAPTVGTTIEASIPGVSGSFTTAVALDGSDLFYMLDVPGDISGTPAKEGGLEGDTVSFSIGGRVLATAPWHSGTHTQVDLNSFAIDLLPGWNLVSFPLLPASTKPADVLASINGSFDTVFAWNAASQSWRMYDNNPITTDTLPAIDEKMGVWIHMTAPATLLVSGAIPASTSIPLSASGAGWNLVGFPAAGPKAVVTAAPSSSSMIFAYNAGDSADPWKMYDKNAPGWVNDLSSLTPGWGYWVQATLPVEPWLVSYP